MTDIVISFDTEDYVNPVGADGILDVATFLKEENIRGCFNIVGWLAQALVKWGRQDVIEALKFHEIESHSLRHTHHPTICEYTDIEDFDKAMARFRKEEDEGTKIIREIIGNDKFYAFCPPGDSFSYVAHYGSADMGIPIHDGDNINVDWVQGRPVTWCNQDCYAYNFGFDCIINWSKEEILAKIDQLAGLDNCIVYHHPQRSRITEFSDVLNFNRKNIEGEWVLSELHPPEKVEKFRENFRFLVRTLKEDPRFRIVTYQELAEKYGGTRQVSLSDIPALKTAIEEDLFPVTVPESISLADMMLACRDFLLGETVHTCDKVYGFLEPPYAVPQPVAVTKEELVKSAEQIKDEMFLPTVLEVGDKKLGPADWLRAALSVLSGEEVAKVVPDKWQIDLNEFPKLRDCNLRGSWLHADTLEDKYLSDRMRLQTWTMRLPKGTKRKIF